jgi:hypothetical protein
MMGACITDLLAVATGSGPVARLLVLLVDAGLAVLLPPTVFVVLAVLQVVEAVTRHLFHVLPVADAALRQPV